MLKLLHAGSAPGRSWPSLPFLSSVRGRIVAGFGLLVIILAVGAVGSAWQTRTHQSDLAEMQTAAATVSLLQETEGDATFAVALLQLYVSTGDEKPIPEIRSNLATAKERLLGAEAEEQALRHEEGAARFGQFLSAVGIASDMAEQVITLRQRDDVQGATTTIALAAPSLLAAKQEFDKFVEVQRQELVALRSEADQTADIAFWFAGLGGTAGAIIAGAASFFNARSILRPLSRLEAAAQAVAGGDLAARAPTTGPRELAHLGQTLNGMTESLLDASQRRELEEARSRLTAVLEATTDLVSIADARGHSIYINKAGRRMLGIGEDEDVTKVTVADCHPRAVYAFLREKAMPALMRQGVWSGETAVLTRDGREIPVSQVIVAHRAADGEVEFLSTIIRDISERNRAEEALRESEERYRDLFENASDLIQAVGPDGRIIYVNRAWQEILGYDEEDTANLSIFDIIDPNYRAHCTEIFRRLMSGEMLDKFEAEFVTKDGRNITVEGSANCKFVDGQPVSSRGIFRDITERKRAEEALRRLNQELEADRKVIEQFNRSLEERVHQRTEELRRANQELRKSEDRTRAILETAADGIITADEQGIIQSFNPAAESMFGYTGKEMIGQNLNILMPPPYREQHDAYIANYLRTDRKKIICIGREVVGRRKDGSTFPMDLAVSEVHLGDRRLFTGIVRDISERKQAEEALHLANEELRQRHRQLLDARAQAATDALTGLPNHRAFHERIRAEVAQAQKNRTGIGLIMLDIDVFKRVNDSLGHLSGDQLLRDLALTLAGVVRREDAYRYGGDEFAVLLPGVDRRKAMKIAERLRCAVVKRTARNGAKVTASLGVAFFPDTAGSAEELIYGADAAMYWAKSAGKNRVGDWSELLNRRAVGTVPWYAADGAVKAPDVVAALVAALAAKDPATLAHTERCSWYSARLAEELGLDRRETSIVRLSSLLHDIGKLAVPDEVLFKPGPLNEAEWVQMRQHPVTALNILGHVRSIADATPAILHHHEQFDGSGYPDGLAGDDIPIASRILLVTDAFDAMTTDRPYRKAMPVNTAIEELKRNTGSQFDPMIVEAFLRVLDSYGAEPLCRMAAAEGNGAGAAPLAKANGISHRGIGA